MFKIRVQTKFCALHQLMLPDGSKEPSHSHTWLVTAQVAGSNLSEAGFVMNFDNLKTLLDKIVAEFDNIQLNELDYFKKNNPSAEHVAKYIYDALAPVLPAAVKLEYIEAEEKPGYGAKYYQE